MSKLETAKVRPGLNSPKTTSNALNASGQTYSGSTLSSGDDSIDVHSYLALTIAFHPLLSRLGERAVLDPVLTTQLSRHETVFQSNQGGPQRPLGDPYVSRQALLIMPTMAGGARLVCGGPKLRARFNGKPLDNEAQLTAEELSAGVLITLADRVVLLLRNTHDEPCSAQSYGLVGESQCIRTVRACIEKAAASDVPVLLRGETGTGKELVARAIAASSQRDKPYVAVNMSAIRPEMATAEFFGVQRNSATGVDAREGLFASARGGTLFLDEVGLAHVQVLNTLLRALDTGEIQRVGGRGGDRTQSHVRLISATDANLELAIEQGAFSQAILQRLGSYPIQLPSLRERREDIGLLLIHFLQSELDRLGQSKLLAYEPANQGWLRASLVARIAQYGFPGNVRELRNLAQALAIHSCALPEARLPDEWERVLDRSLTDENDTGCPSIGIPLDDRRSQAGGSTTRSASTQPPTATAGATGDCRSQSSTIRPGRSVTDDEFREVARSCKFSKSAMAAELGWDRRLVDKRCKALGMRSAKDIAEPEFAQAIRKFGWDWDRLADALEVSKKSLQDRFRTMSPVQER